jgi:hypothetical protein
VLRGPLERPVLRVLPDHRVLQGHKESTDFKEQLVPRVQQDKLELKEQQARRAWKDCRAQPVPKDLQVSRELSGNKVFRVSKVLRIKVTKVSKVYKEPRVFKVLMASTVFKVVQVLRVFKVFRVFKE